uniref:Uncharacterized protein n=1 Tax=Picornavirales sp. TaxID=1955153 RepID=A0A6M3YNS2_9VIRU|nr:MAG: hypothetical protein 3 [Picornavirales sp.]
MSCENYRRFVTRNIDSLTCLYDAIRCLAPSINHRINMVMQGLRSAKQKILAGDFAQARATLVDLEGSLREISAYPTTDTFVRNTCVNAVKITRGLTQNGIDILIKNCPAERAPGRGSGSPIMSVETPLYTDYLSRARLPFLEATVPEMRTYAILHEDALLKSAIDELSGYLAGMFDFELRTKEDKHSSYVELNNQWPLIHRKCVYCMFQLPHCMNADQREFCCEESKCVGIQHGRALITSIQEHPSWAFRMIILYRLQLHEYLYQFENDPLAAPFPVDVVDMSSLKHHSYL